MTRKFTATWTCDVTNDINALKAIYPLRIPVFGWFLEYMHQWAYRHGCHDEVICSWWYRGLAKITIRSKKNEQFHKHLTKELSDHIDNQIIEKLLNQK